VAPPDEPTPFDPFDEPQRDPAPESADERAAAARAAAIAAGRRKGGIAGAALAGSMLALRDIYEGPSKEEIPIEIEASSEPHDVDRDGVDLSVDGVAVNAPPLPRLRPR
jgi:hypothetical protein